MEYSRVELIGINGVLNYNKLLHSRGHFLQFMESMDEVKTPFDIGFDDYLEIIYPGEQKIFRDHLLSVLKPTNDFFKEYIGKSFYTPFRPILITSIRLGIQQYAISTDLNEITFIKEEGAE